MKAQPLLLALALCGGSARAEPHTLRLASVAPEGSAWARASRAFARDVEARSNGEVKVKFYFGGIAGDEMQAAERVRRDQLDGVASGGVLCSRMSTSMRVTRLLGLLQSRDEARYVLGRLKDQVDAEFRAGGFTNLIVAGIGPDILFSRHAVRSFAELRRTRWWVWDLDDMVRSQLPLIGIQPLPLSLDAAGRAYDAAEVDGFIALPTAALAFQWSARTRYVTELHLGFMSGCLLIADRAFDALAPTAQEALRSAAAKFAVLMEDLGREQDDALLGGLFERQGLRSVPVSDGFRSEFLENARAAREKLGEQLVPQALILRVSSWLADYRAEHRAKTER